jgi:hypothetical protein
LRIAILNPVEFSSFAQMAVFMGIPKGGTFVAKRTCKFGPMVEEARSILQK